MLIQYAGSANWADQVELTKDALIARRTRHATVTLPLAEIEWIRFFVGTKQNHSWHDEITFGGRGRIVVVTSIGAHPDGIRESRALYRKFVRLALKRMEAAGATPRIPAGGVPRWVGTSMLAVAAVLTVLALTTLGSGEPSALVCFVPSAFLWLGGIAAWRNPPRFVDLADARDVAVPEKGAD